jgi:hypothetical protein
MAEREIERQSLNLLPRQSFEIRIGDRQLEIFANPLPSIC